MSKESGPALIDTDLVDPNPENPRLIFDPKEMDILLESIKEVGILVPIIVYPKDKGRFVLLDGERRFRCAKRLSMKQIPVNVITPPSSVENVLRMFNIHKVREQWELMPTALSLKKIIDYLQVTGENKLAELTGMTRTEVKRCKILLSFSVEQQQQVLSGELKPDFLIEMYPVLSSMKKTFPDVYEAYGRNGLVESFLKMQDTGKIKAVTDFRKLAKVLTAQKKGVSKARIRESLEKLFTDKRFTFDDAYEHSVRVVYQASDLKRSIGSLLAELQEAEIDVDTLQSQADLVQALKDLQREIHNWLSRIK